MVTPGVADDFPQHHETILVEDESFWLRTGIVTTAPFRGTLRGRGQACAEVLH